MLLKRIWCVLNDRVSNILLCSFWNAPPLFIDVNVLLKVYYNEFEAFSKIREMWTCFSRIIFFTVVEHSALLTTMASKVPALVTHNIQTSIFRVHLDRTVRECCHTSFILIWLCFEFERCKHLIILSQFIKEEKHSIASFVITVAHKFE